MYSVKDVENAFVTFHRWVREPLFGKGKRFEYWCERDLLPHVRFFLLGHFGLAIPELKTKVEANPGGSGYFDFFIPGVAIELAVRGPYEGKSKLTAYTNRDERRKLARRAARWTLKRGALVLLDFSREPLSNDLLEDYRSTQHIEPQGKPLSNFSVLYYFINSETDETECIRKNIRF